MNISTIDNKTDSGEFQKHLLTIQPQLFGFMLSLIRDRDTAEDLLQEVNRLILEKKDQFEPGTNFRAWAFKICRFKIMEHRKKMKNSSTSTVSPEVLDQVADRQMDHLDNDWEYLEKMNLNLEGCIGQLNENSQKLIQQRYQDKKTVRHISKSLNLTEGNLQQKFFRIRNQLKRCLDSKTGENTNGGLTP